MILLVNSYSNVYRNDSLFKEFCTDRSELTDVTKKGTSTLQDERNQRLQLTSLISTYLQIQWSHEVQEAVCHSLRLIQN